MPYLVLTIVDTVIVAPEAMPVVVVGADVSFATRCHAVSGRPELFLVRRLKRLLTDVPYSWRQAVGLSQRWVPRVGTSTYR